MLKTNVSGLLYVTHAILPGMVARNKGHVINVGSTAGHHVYQAGLIYCMSKTAVKTISEGLKEDLQGTAVRVSEVDPGFVETDFHSRRYQGNEEKVAAMLGGFTPLKAEDVAEAIVFAATRPAHVNVMEIVLHSVDQTKQGHIFRKGE
jgi:NADP-dependent 3-hydroxy acid dehydrogenase YdfG